MTMRKRLKMKNRLHRYDMSKSRPKHGAKYTKHQICLSTMMVYMHYVTAEQYFKCPFIRKLKQH